MGVSLLKPEKCPICGGKAKVDRCKPIKGSQGRWRVIVRCLDGCQGKADKQKPVNIMQDYKENLRETVNRAVIEWNKLPRTKTPD